MKLSDRILSPSPIERAEAILELDRLEAREKALVECLRELVEDVTNEDHEPHDWSEQVVIKRARALLEYK